MGALIDLTGQVFNRLTVVKRADTQVKGSAVKWQCVCSCGAKSIVNGASLRSGHTKSCGCIQREWANTSKHGMCNTPEYGVWAVMLQRCNNPKNDRYIAYGARGITVCHNWQASFDSFITDMGKRPTSKHSLDRVNNDKGYYKSNCRWATRKEQDNNKQNSVHITHKGYTGSITQVADRFSVIPAKTVHDRLRLGWSIEKSLYTAKRHYSKSL